MYDPFDQYRDTPIPVQQADDYAREEWLDGQDRDHDRDFTFTYGKKP